MLTTNMWHVAFVYIYLLTRAGDAQVADDPAAVCDDDRCWMMKQLTDVIQQTLAHEDVLEPNMINIYMWLWIVTTS